jgi:hypothetical protein
MHAATSKVESSAQGLSCQLKFLHAPGYAKPVRKTDLPEKQICQKNGFARKPDLTNSQLDKVGYNPNLPMLYPLE